MSRGCQLTALALSVTALSLSGCATTRLAPAETPETELSTIAFHGTDGVRLIESRVDDQVLGIFAKSAAVLAGSHAVRAVARLEVEDCYPEARYCEVEIITAECAAGFSTKPGRAYLITVKEQRGSIVSTALAKSYFDFSERDDESPLATVQCTERSRTQTVRYKSS